LHWRRWQRWWQCAQEGSAAGAVRHASALALFGWWDNGDSGDCGFVVSAAAIERVVLGAQGSGQAESSHGPLCVSFCECASRSMWSCAATRFAVHGCQMRLCATAITRCDTRAPLPAHTPCTCRHTHAATHTRCTSPLTSCGATLSWPTARAHTSGRVL